MHPRVGLRLDGAGREREAAKPRTASLLRRSFGFQAGGSDTAAGGGDR